MAPMIVSNSPHIKSPEDVKSIMWTVVVMLIPAGLMGTVVFGYKAAVIILLSILAAVVTEYLCQKVRKMPVTINDGSAVLAGLLFAYVIPPNTPWYVAIIGASAAILIGKHFFGGLGCNIWNPALVGRAFVGAAYASSIFLAEWPVIKRVSATSTEGAGWFANRLQALQSSLANIPKDISDVAISANDIAYDAVSGASPLKLLKDAAADAAADGTVPQLVKEVIVDQHGLSFMSMLTGHQSGCIGETSAGLLLLGGLFLIFLKIVDWKIPIFFIGTTALLGWALPIGNIGWFSGDPIFQMLAGGLMIGAFFMATDMVTSPITSTGKIIFAVGCGLLTILIRNYGGYPEGVCYSILIMNTAVPLIDRFFKPRLFGQVKS